MIAVPEALTPELAEEIVEVGHTCGEREEADEEKLLFSRRFAQPWRDYRDDEVEADERIHKPEMTGKGGEVERYTGEVVQGCRSIDLSPEHGQCAVEDQETNEGRQDAQGAVTVERPHAFAFFHRDEEIG